MATVPGSQFTLNAAMPVIVVETTTGTGLPPAVAGDFNAEAFIGATVSAPAIAAGYQGLGVLSPSGQELDLISGAFAATDNGTNDTLSTYGSDETITGSSSGTSLNLIGENDTAIGGSGADTITVSGNLDSVIGGTGNYMINVTGPNDTVTSGSGNDQINLTASVDVVNAGSGNDTILVMGSADTISVGTGATGSLNLTGSLDLISMGTGSDSATVVGASDTVTSGANPGANQSVINLTGTDMTLIDGANKYADTVIGFDQTGGDTIQLTTDTVADALAHSTQVNGGADTLITLSDGSTILLKGVSQIDSTFFS